MSLAPSDGSRLWHGDITSPFPPSGNEGYVRNRDVPYLSVTTSYVVMTSTTSSAPRALPGRKEPGQGVVASHGPCRGANHLTARARD